MFLRFTYISQAIRTEQGQARGQRVLKCPYVSTAVDHYNSGKSPSHQHNSLLSRTNVLHGVDETLHPLIRRSVCLHNDTAVQT